MSGLYDRLMNQMGGEEDDKPAGRMALDIADLPEPQRQVMFALLRDSTASTEGIALEALREKLGHPDDLDATLDDLTKHSWLIRQGEPPNPRYKVNLRRKRGSTLGANLWASLTDHLAEETKEQTPPKGPDKPNRPAVSEG